jgi:hypothetical protein
VSIPATWYGWAGASGKKQKAGKSIPAHETALLSFGAEQGT